MAMTLGGSLQGRSLYRSGAGKVASRRFCAVSTSTRRSNVRRVRASAETLESPLSEPSEQTGYRKQVSSLYRKQFSLVYLKQVSLLYRKQFSNLHRKQRMGATSQTWLLIQSFAEDGGYLSNMAVNPKLRRGWGYLSNMAVDPKLCRIGVARSLLSRADSIYLHVCAADEAPVKLYSTSGYVEIAKDGPLVQLTLGMRPRLLMRKVLN
eukprot:gene25593-11246_t